MRLEEIIHKWFEMKVKTYNRLEHDDSIYFYYEGEKYAEFRIDKKYKKIFYKWELYKEFSEIIPLKDIEFEEFINKWVEDTFGLKRFTPDGGSIQAFPPDEDTFGLKGFTPVTLRHTLRPSLKIPK